MARARAWTTTATRNKKNEVPAATQLRTQHQLVVCSFVVLSAARFSEWRCYFEPKTEIPLGVTRPDDTISEKGPRLIRCGS